MAEQKPPQERMQPDTKRSLFIAWGLAIFMVGLAFIVGGPYWGLALMAIGLVLVLHGHFPKLFDSRTAIVIAALSLLIVILGGVRLSPFGRNLLAKKSSPGPTQQTPVPPQFDPKKDLGKPVEAPVKPRSHPKPKLHTATQIDARNLEVLGKNCKSFMFINNSVLSNAVHAGINNDNPFACIVMNGTVMDHNGTAILNHVDPSLIKEMMTEKPSETKPQ